jgi:hypothetical protein
MAYDAVGETLEDGGNTRQAGQHLAIALVVAALLVWGARSLADHFTTGPGAPAAAPLAAPAVVAPQANEAEEQRLAAQARAARQRREQQLVDEDRARREQKKAEVMRARDEAAAASQAAEVARDAAWQRYFSKSKKCDTAVDDATRVECSNQYIRAKERFDKLYAEGKLH